MVCKTIYIGSNPILDSNGVWSFKVKHEFVELGKTVQYRSYTQIAGREVSDQSHKLCFSGAVPDPASKKDLK
jgi:hypothetical protein